jgi:hypothetical protein
MNARFGWVILALIGTATLIRAEQPSLLARLFNTTVTCPPACYNCPDDYCKKQLPCAPACTRCGLPDDYCKKPLPCVPCPVKGCGDDYCGKSFPWCLPPSIEPWYSCGACAPPASAKR